MASPSPPKPWERAGAAGATTAAVPAATQTPTATTIPSSMSTTIPPSLPDRPNSLNSVVNRTASNYSSLNANRYGTSPYGYGTYGGYNSYSSPYNRFGGGYGSMYGGYGSMYGGMGGMYGGGMGGMGQNPNDPNSLTQSFSNSTQATFQLIESIVGAFGGFAQMLESTYMATHSSFFAMVSVAEQFGNLRQTLGSVLGIFTLMRWMRALIAKLTGRPPPASGRELTPSNFAAFSGAPTPDGAHPRPSKKPLIMFALAVFGLPYLMGKLIRTLARGQEEEEQRRLQAAAAATDPQAAAAAAYANGGDASAAAPLDPSKLDFCRALYDYAPDGAGVPGVDLSVKKGDLVAVLSKTDPLGNASEWWRCRARDGGMGYLPSPYLEPIQRRQQAAITSGSQPGSAQGSRAQTMTASASGSAPGSRSATMTEAKPVIDGKPGDIGVESFQKGQFYS